MPAALRKCSCRTVKAWSSRGALGPWFQTDTKQFHLDQDAASNLIEMVVGEYVRLHDGPPPSSSSTQSRPSPTMSGVASHPLAEPKRILSACRFLTLAMTSSSIGPASTPSSGAPHFRLARATPSSGRQATYPGSTPTWDPRPRIPSPSRVVRGQCDLTTVLSDVLGLTKINFNSCLHNDRMPVTIRFANAVGDVLISAPMDSEPKLPFKYYI